MTILQSIFLGIIQGAAEFLPISSSAHLIIALWLLVIATVPGILAGYFFEPYAESTFRSPILIAVTLSAVGLILYIVDKYHTHRKNLKQISWLDSLFVGLSQAVAIIPGVSRSGATITTGLAMGLKRESAARFSFLLSTPKLLGAG